MLPLLFLLVGCGSEHGFSHFLPDNPIPENVPAYDIIVVLDTSGSMDDNTYIDYGFTQIPVDLDSRGADWQMAFTAASQTVHSHIEVNPSSNGWDVLDKLTEIRHYQYNGAEEAGIGAAIRWYKEELGWLRPEATPILVFVSDEDDHSTRENWEVFNYWPPSTYVLSITGIAQYPESSCNTAEVGQKYIDISSRVMDICTTNQWSILEN